MVCAPTSHCRPAKATTTEITCIVRRVTTILVDGPDTTSYKISAVADRRATAKGTNRELTDFGRRRERFNEGLAVRLPTRDRCVLSTGETRTPQAKDEEGRASVRKTRGDVRGGGMRGSEADGGAKGKVEECKREKVNEVRRQKKKKCTPHLQQHEGLTSEIPLATGKDRLCHRSSGSIS